VARVQRGVVRLADHTAGRVQRREALRQPGQVAEVFHRGIAAYVALAEERRAVDAAERHRVAADVHRVLRVAGLYVELARRLGDLFEYEVRVELHAVVLDGLPGLAEQRERLVGHELDTDLGDDPAPALVEHPQRVGGQDLVPRHGVAEHPTSRTRP
jgi:hypothetical protein